MKQINRKTKIIKRYKMRNLRYKCVLFGFLYPFFDFFLQISGKKISKKSEALNLLAKKANNWRKSNKKKVGEY